MNVQPNTSSFKIPKEEPVWVLGYPYNMHVAFKIARRFGKELKGRKGYPPLKDEWDVYRDFDANLANTPISSPWGSKEGGRAMSILRWSADLLMWETGDQCIVDSHTNVHRRRSTKQRLIVEKAWNFKDLDIEIYRAANELPEQGVLDVLRKYLGKPRWFLYWGYIERNKLLPALQSGAFQAMVGMDVDPASNDAQVAQSSMDVGETAATEAEEEHAREFAKLSITDA
ncbi:uncharacterized protein TRAVEDRAFT_24774 [Trametes versicolor FP-101664 SS1]|uniref:Uncharacterized protein n=1 Tax=Trametes versicolor (strain FP-101664) TaxID=717944 RepID=R7S8Y0_TRAVS|nr:uncharacterized protein TRAVEDRAFT_24774 [Trametes versicolor FP-101664 SS1]EIW52092.1 hypothetical protein TRAVEDRAFT_24774 [Trametes versicolor FP-101664 SS1]